MEEKPTSIEEPVATQPPVEQSETELLTPSFGEKLKTHKFLPAGMQGKILGGVLAVLVVAGAVLGAYKLGQKQVQPQPSPTPEAVATSTPDPTADWQTYKNETLGFEFKYPNDHKWNVKENLSASSVALYNYDVDKAPGRDYVPSIDGDLFKIEIYVNKNYANANQWFEEEKQKINPMTNEPYEFSNIKSITVDSRKGTYYESKAVYDQMLGSAVFESPRDEIIHFYGGLNYEGNKEVFNLIILSFKFLEESETWKTYSNDIYHYSLRYPPDFSMTDHSVAGKKQGKFSQGNYEIIARASKEKEGIYYLDQESVGEIRLGGMLGKLYKFPNGYCDGPSCSPPFVAAVTYLSDNQYVMEFYGTTEVTGIYQQVLSTFRAQL